MSKWSRLWSALRTAGHASFYLLMGACVLMFIAIGVAEILNSNRQTYWGTFTEQTTSCDPLPRRTCTHTGTWVSDDGTIVKVGITLDGSVDPAHSVRAGYRPGGLLGDDENNIVHTAFWSRAGLWFPWVAAVCVGAFTWQAHRRWRREPRARGYVGRHFARDLSK